MKTPPSDPTTIGRYQVLRWLRDTRLAHVYHCVQNGRGGPGGVELHVLRGELHGDRARVAAFLAEGRLTARLRHRGLPDVIEVSTSDGVPYAVHALTQGPTLHQLQSAKGWGRSLDLRMVVRLGHDVADALAHAWLAEDERGQPIALVHGGLSPDRLVVAPEGFARIIDFGTLSGPRYHAPEILGGAGPSPRADVFALGVVLYALVTGQHAWPGRDVDPLRTGRLVPPQVVRPDVPHDLDAIVRHCLESRPPDRPRDAVVLRERLAGWLDAHGGAVSDQALAAWGVVDAPSDGPRLVGSHGAPGLRIVAPEPPPPVAERPTRTYHEALEERPTVQDVPVAVVRDLPAPGAEALTVPHPGAIAARLAAIREAEETRVRPVWAAVWLVLVAMAGGLALLWYGPALGLPADDAAWWSRFGLPFTGLGF